MQARDIKWHSVCLSHEGLVFAGLGESMGRPAKIWELFVRFRLLLVAAIAVACYLVFLSSFRHSSYLADPLLDTFLDMAGSLIAFTFAANAMIRFRGTHDRISLTLALGFVVAGLIEAGTSVSFYHGMLITSTAVHHISLAWLAGRTLLGVLLLAALLVERRIPLARDPGKEIAGAILVVAAVAYLTSVFYFMMPEAPRIHPGSLVPRPWDLLPAAIYMLATVGYGWRLRRANASLDRALFVAAGLNVICHVTIAESQRGLDAPFMLAHVLMVLSYIVVLGGTLLDNAQLFAQVSRLAASDSLTGLANHRRLIEVLEIEIERSRRTHRSFALLLFDLDELKKINDRFGHLTGSQAIKRLGSALRSNSRTIDTAARYGGDEFAVVLPEIGEEAAQGVAARICSRLANDGQVPHVTVSVGVSVYPADGTTIEKLFGAADRALYRMKRGEKKTFALGNVAAML